jgi:hypothetical protein
VCLTCVGGLAGLGDVQAMAELQEELVRQQTEWQSRQAEMLASLTDMPLGLAAMMQPQLIQSLFYPSEFASSSATSAAAGSSSSAGASSSARGAVTLKRGRGGRRPGRGRRTLSLATGPLPPVIHHPVLSQTVSARGHRGRGRGRGRGLSLQAMIEVCSTASYETRFSIGKSRLLVYLPS